MTEPMQCAMPAITRGQCEDFSQCSENGVGLPFILRGALGSAGLHPPAWRRQFLDCTRLYFAVVSGGANRVDSTTSA